MRAAAVLVVLLVTPALAGCADEAAPAAQQDTLRPANTGSGGGVTTSTPIPKPATERWHFHDYWKGSPTIELLNRTVELNATTDAQGLPALSAIFTLDEGIIVPPETGQLDVVATWASEFAASGEGAAGLLNLTYRPADANTFQPGGDLANGGVVTIRVTETMADVPHRAGSLWAFNLSAKAGGTPPELPPRMVHVTVTATIGRPLFIDPPHLDWWQGNDVIPLVMGAKGQLQGSARTPAGNVTIPQLGGPTSPTPGDFSKPARVPVDAERIVPEGTRTLVVLLNWTSEVPDQKLLVRYREGNLGMEGPLEVAKDGATNRVFVLAVDNDQTDTTYSNRTTWEFEVVPEGDAGAFRGEFTFYAWVARVETDRALRQTIGTL